jgi:hypothetical protein
MKIVRKKSSISVYLITLFQQKVNLAICDLQIVHFRPVTEKVLKVILWLWAAHKIHKEDAGNYQEEI